MTKTKNFWYKHDIHAHADTKLQALHWSLGMEGEGIYWRLVSYLYDAEGRLPLTDLERIAYTMRVTKSKLEKVITSFQLFDNDGVDFWSDGVLNRIKESDQLSNTRSKSASKRHANAEQVQEVCTTFADTKDMQMQEVCTTFADANDMQMQNKSTTFVDAVEKSRVEKSRVEVEVEKKRKEKDTTNINHPSTARAAEVVSKGKAVNFQPDAVTATILQRHDVAQAWDEFLHQRKNLKAPNTHYALTLIVNKLHQFRGTDGAGWAELLNLAVERGWRSIFENNENKLILPKQHATKPTLNERYNDAARQLLQGS